MKPFYATPRRLALQARKAALDTEQSKAYHGQRANLVTAFEQKLGRTPLPTWALDDVDDMLLTEINTGKGLENFDIIAYRETLKEMDIRDQADRLRTLDEARKRVAAEQNSSTGRTYTDGATFIFNIPDIIPAVWGNGKQVLWAEGEALMICGTPGVGKTTIAGQVIHALIHGGEVLGLPVTPHGKILYLAMDRPQQIARSLHRQFQWPQSGVKAVLEYRKKVEENLIIWTGPPPGDLAQNPDILTSMCQDAGATVVIIDSLKDAAIGLEDATTGAAYNSARQKALANGIQVLELHHQVKRGKDGAAPDTLADVFGSTYLTGGAGSVIVLSGIAGDLIVGFKHLKQPAEPVGPFRIMHNQDTGTSTIWNQVDPLDLAHAAGPAGITARALAAAINDTKNPSRNDIERARRDLAALVKAGKLTEQKIAAPDGEGGKARIIYLAHNEAPGTTCQECGDDLQPAYQEAGYCLKCQRAGHPEASSSGADEGLF